MVPWELVDEAEVPGGADPLRLYRRGDEFSIRVGRQELMNSRTYGSEDALAELSCERLASRGRVRVLIGGLGMGYTAAAALRVLGDDARVVIAELVPAVVEWNRGPLGAVAGHPLTDRRVSVAVGDVADVMRDGAGFDAILLDVDNGPEGLTRRANDGLYGDGGLRRAMAALAPGGELWVWSAGQRPGFAQRLRRVGFDVREHRVRARARRKGSHHLLWCARKPARGRKS